MTTLGALAAPGNDSCVGGPFGSSLTSADYVERGVPVIRGSNLDGQACRFLDRDFVFVDDEKARELRRNTAVPGDMIFTQRGTLGQVAIIPPDATYEHYIVSQSQMRLRVDESIASPSYVYWYFRSPYAKRVLEMSTLATGVPHINLGILREFPINIPPLPEQRRIAAILDKADAIRRKRQEAIALTDELLRSAFLEMFGDPVSNPKGWPVRPLGEVVRLHAGNSLPAGVPFSGQEGGFLLLKVGDMNIPGNELEVSVAREWAKSVPGAAVVAPAGAVVIPKRGGAIATNKKRILTRPAALDPNLMAIAPSSTLVLAYLRQWFAGVDLATLSNGTAVPQLNKKDLDPLPLPVPPIGVQEQFSAVAGKVQAMRVVSELAQASSNALLESLTARAFSGEL